MTRTSVSEVKKIASFPSLTDSEIEAFIEDANVIVDDRMKGHASDAKLALLEKWLSAHLAKIRDRRVTESEVGDTAFTYEGEAGMGLEATQYGQQAVALDTTGRLEASPNYVKTVWDEGTGKPPEP